MATLTDPKSLPEEETTRPSHSFETDQKIDIEAMDTESTEYPLKIKCCRRKTMRKILAVVGIIVANVCLGIGIVKHNQLDDRPSNGQCMVTPRSWGTECTDDTISVSYATSFINVPRKEIKSLEANRSCGTSGVLASTYIPSPHEMVTNYQQCQQYCTDWCPNVLLHLEDNFNACCESTFDATCKCTASTNLPGSVEVVDDRQVSAVQYFDSDRTFSMGGYVRECYFVPAEPSPLSTEPTCKQDIFRYLNSRLNQPFDCNREHMLCKEGVFVSESEVLPILLIVIGSIGAFCAFGLLTYFLFVGFVHEDELELLGR
eukprot:TRINITY_DN5588_c0_g1_i1.p1 TRINITY_DN5588_c0_g1~~TRINITY_DN5588_c0_g1_i1.p1  ORF type:complete len:316 (+),score=37.44 TRINITY_DN5588_c0_g1_i1:75-1022(+)